MTKKHIPLDRIWAVKATEKKLHSVKAWIFLWLSLIAYGLMFFRLFGQFLAIESMIYGMFFFVFFHFLYLEIRKLPIKYLTIVMLIITIIQGFFIGYTNILLVAAILAINIGIVYLAYFLQGESHDKIKWSTIGYLNVGGYIFTVFITIGYSLFVLWYYTKFPFTCQDLSDTSSRVINIFTKPVTNGMETIKANTDALFNTKVKDIAVIGQDISLQAKQSTSMNFIQKFNTYKKNLVDQTLKDNTSVNMGICDYLLGQMNKIYSDPAFKTSVILLMFLLFYGFIRIEFWIMTGIAFVIFKILFALKVYRIKTVLKEVEDLE